MRQPVAQQVVRPRGRKLDPAEIRRQGGEVVWYGARAQYIGLGVLLERTAQHVVATHDEDMIAAAKSFAQQHGIDPSRFEFQMLYGIRRDLQRKLVSEGYNVRVYVPFGRAWYPYFMRRLAERPANVLFLAKNLLRA